MNFCLIINYIIIPILFNEDLAAEMIEFTLLHCSIRGLNLE